MTLKELRSNSGLTLANVSQRTGIRIPALSLYENDNVLPPLEDMIILEKEFGRKIEWKDNIPSEVMKSINVLFRHYPVTAVTNFLARNLQKNVTFGLTMIKYYAHVADVLEIDPLLPPDP